MKNDLERARMARLQQMQEMQEMQAAGWKPDADACSEPR